MTCELTRAALRAWDPHEDLADPVVGHLDDCTSCRTAFDARHPPPAIVRRQAPSNERPSAHGPRGGLPSSPAWRLVAPILAAAALVAALVTGAQRPAAAGAEPEVCMLDPWLPPECPTT